MSVSSLVMHIKSILNIYGRLMDLEEYRLALNCCERAIELDANFKEAHCGRGEALRLLFRPQEALDSLDRAIQLDPNYKDAHYVRGEALRLLGRLQDSLASHDRAIQLKANFKEAHFGRGHTLRLLGQPQEALVAYNRVLELTAPGNALYDAALHIKQSISTQSFLLAINSNSNNSLSFSPAAHNPLISLVSAAHGSGIGFPITEDELPALEATHVGASMHTHVKEEPVETRDFASANVHNSGMQGPIGICIGTCLFSLNSNGSSFSASSSSSNSSSSSSFTSSELSNKRNNDEADKDVQNSYKKPKL